jgi:PleD family two-component response regulator
VNKNYNSLTQLSRENNLFSEPGPEHDENAQVLIVDDQYFNIMAISAQVKAFGLSVDAAVSGAQALACIK